MFEGMNPLDWLIVVTMRGLIRAYYGVGQFVARLVALSVVILIAAGVVYWVRTW